MLADRRTGAALFVLARMDVLELREILRSALRHPVVVVGLGGAAAAVVFGGWKLGLAARATPHAAALVIAVGSALAFGPALAWWRSGPAESVARGPFGARSPCPPEARIGLGPTP